MALLPEIGPLRKLVNIPLNDALVFTCLYRRGSSAKRRKVDLMSLFISFFIYTRKSKETRTVPCGTPETTGSLREVIPVH